LQITRQGWEFWLSLGRARWTVVHQGAPRFSLAFSGKGERLLETELTVPEETDEPGEDLKEEARRAARGGFRELWGKAHRFGIYRKPPRTIV
jgi:hypothetical protein